MKTNSIQSIKRTILFSCVLSIFSSFHKLNARREVYLSKKHLLPCVILLIPLYQLYRTQPPTKIPSDEKFSWDKTKTKLSALYKTLIYPNNKNNNQEIQNSFVCIWKNIKNLYRTHFIGNLKQKATFRQNPTTGLVEIDKPTIPPRGFMGHFVDKLTDARKASKEIFSLLGLWTLLYSLNKGEISFQKNFEIKAQLYKTVDF